MLNVTQDQIIAWNDETSERKIKLVFPSLSVTINGEKIYKESLEISESVCDSDSAEFVGCISSSMSIQISGLNNNYKGQRVQVFANADDTGDIKIFEGIVDSVTSQSNKTFKKLLAYDELYVKGNTDISAWYNSLTFPISIKNFRDSLFEYLDITQKTQTLVNDSLTFNKEYEPIELQALEVIMNICQINGTMGIMDRDGEFEYRDVSSRVAEEGTYPSLLTFPSATLFPSSNMQSRSTSGEDATVYAFYRKCEYEEYITNNIGKVTVRQTDAEDGQSYGSGNNYIIQGNFFTLNMAENKLLTIAQNILTNIKDVIYRPFSANIYCLPYVECGDVIRVSTAIGILDFTVFSRKIKGIQAMQDSVMAKGTQNQMEFISDVPVRINQLQRNVDVINRTLGRFDARITALEQGGGGGGVKAKSVQTLPTDPDPNTIFLIQGIVVVN